jgi:hypothetical protein
MDVSNKNIKNRLVAICTLDYRQLLAKASFFEIRKKNGHGLCVLAKIKHVGHVFHLILVPGF